MLSSFFLPAFVAFAFVRCSVLLEGDQFEVIRSCVEKGDSVQLQEILDSSKLDLNQRYLKTFDSGDELRYSLLMEAVELALEKPRQPAYLEIVRVLLDHDADPFVMVGSRHGPISAWWTAGGDLFAYERVNRDPLLEIRKQIFMMFLAFHERMYPEDTNDVIVDRFVARLFPEEFCDFSLDLARSIPTPFFDALNKPGNAHLSLFIVMQESPKAYMQFQKMGLRFDVPVEDGLLPLMYLVEQETTSLSTPVLHVMMKDPDVLASINAVDDFGCTALMRAAMVKNSDCVELMLASGADPNIKNPITGMTALSMVKKAKYESIASILLEHGANEATEK